MNVGFEKRLLVVWLVLSAITLVSRWMGLLDDPAAPTPNAVIATGVIVIALVKTRIIFREFMEVRHAPVLLGRITDTWLLVTALCLLGAYFVGMPAAPGDGARRSSRATMYASQTADPAIQQPAAQPRCWK